MSSGKVFLIGAGPGDVELLTLHAVRTLGLADVVLLDDLVNRDVLQFVRRDARIVEVGKRGGCKSTPQAFIHRLMVALANQGKVVARVKGGDPFMFGRGGEEVERLTEAGIAAEVVAAYFRHGGAGGAGDSRRTAISAWRHFRHRSPRRDSEGAAS
jgi:uroporphyrin-III C-methyltransferase